MVLRLVIVPAILTLAVTILRLIGELRHWPAKWFSPETGGIHPSGVSWVVGITWLAAIFGAYFALRLARTGKAPRSLGKAAAFAALGVLIFLTYRSVAEFIIRSFDLHFPQYLILVWFLWSVAAAIQYFGWPELFKVLLTYAYAARIPVAIVMLLAMLGNWGTHYDYVGVQIPLSGISRYLWLAFFPQLVAWVGFTITLGSVAGVLAVFIATISGWPARNKVDRIDVS
jgi:hypothetical protein